MPLISPLPRAPGPPRWVARLLPSTGAGPLGRCLGVLVAVLVCIWALVLPAGAVDESSAPSSPDVLPAMPATGNDWRRARAQNSPDIAVDPTDSSFVALANRLDKPDFSCALQLSGDGGRLWAPVDPVPVLPEGAAKCYGPEVAFDADGAADRVNSPESITESPQVITARVGVGSG